MILRNPKFGNLITLSTRLIDRRTMGGTSKLYYDSRWPILESFNWNIEALTPTQKDELLQFFLATVGQEIEITDYENRVWRGLIIEEPEFIESRRQCGWDATLVFEGHRI